MGVRLAGWGGMLALSSLAAGSDEERGKVQSLTLTACPPSYKQLIADHQQKVSSNWPPSISMRSLIHAPSWMLAFHLLPWVHKGSYSVPLSGACPQIRISIST